MVLDRLKSRINMASSFSANPAEHYCELHAHSRFALPGEHGPAALAERAASLGLPALALTQTDSLSGAPAFQRRALELGLRPVLGAELTLEDGSQLTLLAENQAGYASLCHLISAGRAAGSRLSWIILGAHTRGLICLTGGRDGRAARCAAEGDLFAAREWLRFLADVFGRGQVYVEVQRRLDRDDMKISRRLSALAFELGLPCVATGGLPSPSAGLTESMRSLFPDLPEAITNTRIIAERCRARLPFDRLTFHTPGGPSAADRLRQMCLAQLPAHCAPDEQAGLEDRLEAELVVLGQTGLADHYLAAADLVEFCERENILYLGTGPSTVTAALLGLGTGEPDDSALLRPPVFTLDVDAAERGRLADHVLDAWGPAQVLAAADGCLAVTGAPAADLMPVVPGPLGEAQSEFASDDLAALGVFTIQLRGQSALTAIAETLRLARENATAPLARQPAGADDPAVFALIRSARTVGLAPAGARLDLAPCLQPESWEDLLVETTLMIRPSPLRRRMVDHYQRRRAGLEPPTAADPLLAPILAATQGVVIYEEQAVAIARAAAGFPARRGEDLRQALKSGDPYAVERLRLEFMEGALLTGMESERAERLWSMLTIYAQHACSRAEAASATRLIYWAAWLRLTHPAEYFCGQLRAAGALGSALPVLESEARRAGVRFLPFDVNRSWARPSVENGAIRLGLTHEHGLDAGTTEALLLARGGRSFRSLSDLIKRTRLDRQPLEWLILSGAVDSLGERPHLLWELAETFNVARRPEPKSEALAEFYEPGDMSEEQQMLSMFAAATGRTRLQLTEVRRDAFTQAGCLPWERLRASRPGARVKVGGLVSHGVRRAPEGDGSASLRLDGPDGSVEVAVPAEVYVEFRQALRAAFLVIDGQVMRQGPVMKVRAARIVPLD